MLSTEIDARIMREKSNDLEDLHRFDKSRKTITRQSQLGMEWGEKPFQTNGHHFPYHCVHCWGSWWTTWVLPGPWAPWRNWEGASLQILWKLNWWRLAIFWKLQVPPSPRSPWWNWSKASYCRLSKSLEGETKLHCLIKLVHKMLHWSVWGVNLTSWG